MTPNGGTGGQINEGMEKKGGLGEKPSIGAPKEAPKGQNGGEKIDNR
jgi:hypothetical protein